MDPVIEGVLSTTYSRFILPPVDFHIAAVGEFARIPHAAGPSVKKIGVERTE